MKKACATVAMLMVLTSCRSDAPTKPVDDETKPGGGGARSEVRVQLNEVATLDEPVAFAVHPSGPSPVYIAEKGGRVRALDVNGEGSASEQPDSVLDVSDEVSTGSEQGLLGIAFHPTGTRLYANFTNRAGDTRVVEYPFADGKADKSQARTLLAVDQPFANHNGGHLVFGPDKMLYIGLGDGGSGGDPQGNGQKLSTLLGKILRIEPTASGYSAPTDNPFVAKPVEGARPEIWHFGLRNPWRFSFDRANGDLWIADVGQDEWEEINHVDGDKGGINFGWNRREGKHRFLGAEVADAVDPEIELSHSDGNCSVTGGYVYRGAKIAALTGKYVFGDFCRGELMAASGGRASELGAKVENLAAFGQDADGELWALSLNGPVYRLVGAS
ncbi:MAG TPA: PQQ-dependent sugar dehydrogenase [Acidimicrobiales bacterium]|nr:PQQ-dependent sugar dehydrogenase [Acidimicrobiales bacterium]